jgi:hypothetical protein
MLKKMTEIGSEGNRWTVRELGHRVTGRDTVMGRW